VFLFDALPYSTRWWYCNILYYIAIEWNQSNLKRKIWYENCQLSTVNYQHYFILRQTSINNLSFSFPINSVKQQRCGQILNSIKRHKVNSKREVKGKRKKGEGGRRRKTSLSRRHVWSSLECQIWVPISYLPIKKHHPRPRRAPMAKK
jgi:hypothetical protein